MKLKRSLNEKLILRKIRKSYDKESRQLFDIILASRKQFEGKYYKHLASYYEISSSISEADIHNTCVDLINTYENILDNNPNDFNSKLELNNLLVKHPGVKNNMCKIELSHKEKLFLDISKIIDIALEDKF